MEQIKHVIQQEIIENQFNKKLLRVKLQEIIKDSYFMYVDKAIEAVNAYMNQEYYASKNKRIEKLKELDIQELVINLLAGTLQYQAPYPFTAACGELAGALGWSDKPDAIKTIGELLAVVCSTDAYDLSRKSDESFEIISRLGISDELVMWYENTQYLPPMVVKPNEVKHNKDAGYLTIKDSLILGKGNHHNGNICLDAINTANSVQLKLDTDFVSKYELVFSPSTKPKRKTVTPMGLRAAIDNFSLYKKMTYRTMALIAITNNKFYLTHRVDKRGRLYSCGYHVNSQGTAYNKACIEFAEQEHIDVPSEYQL